VCCFEKGTRKTGSYQGLETLSSIIETDSKATGCASGMAIYKYG